MTRRRPESGDYICPLRTVLQAQDGSFYGTDGAGNMVRLSQSGNVIWSVPNDSPQITTADGGVIGASGITYDNQGHATGQVSLPVQSWLGNGYQNDPGQAQQVAFQAIIVAPSFWAYAQANASASNTAAVNYEPPQAGLQTIAQSNLTAQPTCNTFLNNLTTIAVANGRNPGGQDSRKLP